MINGRFFARLFFSPKQNKADTCDPATGEVASIAPFENRAILKRPLAR